MDRWRPKSVELPELTCDVRVHLLRTGPFHCIVSFTNNRVFSWGRGDCGQTGLGIRQHVNVPHPMTHLMDIVGDQPLRLLAVRAHNVAVTAFTGEVVVWGRNNYAQLGLAVSSHIDPDGSSLLESHEVSDFDDHSEPKVNTTLAAHGISGADISDMSVGPFHTSVVLNDGHILKWGAVNEQGIPRTNPQVHHHDDDENIAGHIPIPVAALSDRIVTHIGAGYSHIIFVVDPPRKIGQSTLAWDLAVSLDDPTFSDISLVVQDRTIRAHRVILASRCKFFRAMFSSGMLETKQREVVLRDCSYDAFYALVLYLYTDSFYKGPPSAHTAQLALDVLPLAEIYDLPRLLQLCEATIIDSQLLSLDNVVEFYELACRLRAINLRGRCHWFISKYYQQIALTESWILKLPQDLKDHFHPISKLHAQLLHQPQHASHLQQQQEEIDDH